MKKIVLMMLTVLCLGSHGMVAWSVNNIIDVNGSGGKDERSVKIISQDEFDTMRKDTKYCKEISGVGGKVFK
ncbi:MAG: hypothetical protein LBU29_03185 [Endomicrobium sp.]|jgi:hypothetical protein|nr:hypothetical protein [Endomicrobium sp.]